MPAPRNVGVSVVLDKLMMVVPIFFYSDKSLVVVDPEARWTVGSLAATGGVLVSVRTKKMDGIQSGKRRNANVVTALRPDVESNVQ
jgi:hypothetical protein